MGGHPCTEQTGAEAAGPLFSELHSGRHTDRAGSARKPAGRRQDGSEFYRKDCCWAVSTRPQRHTRVAVRVTADSGCTLRAWREACRRDCCGGWREGLGTTLRWVQGRQRDMGALGGRAGPWWQEGHAQTRLGEQKRAEKETHGQEPTVETAMSGDALGSDGGQARTTLTGGNYRETPAPAYTVCTFSMSLRPGSAHN